MTEERIITAAVVTLVEKRDGPELPKLLEISKQNGIAVDTIIGDELIQAKNDCLKGTYNCKNVWNGLCSNINQHKFCSLCTIIKPKIYF